MSRRIGFRRTAERQLPVQAADIRATLDAYAAGVNAGHSTGLPSKPHEFAILGGEPSEGQSGGGSGQPASADTGRGGPRGGGSPGDGRGGAGTTATLTDSEGERLKFILASYNCGPGHVEDAQRLTEKYGGDPQRWDDVAYWLLQKSTQQYSSDAVVKFGFCRGIEPVNYVSNILERFNHYKQFVVT